MKCGERGLAVRSAGADNELTSANPEVASDKSKELYLVTRKGV